MALAVQLMTQNGTNVHQALANKNDKHVSMSEDSSKRRHLFTWGPRSGVQCSLLEWGVVEQLLDEVDMSQQHTAAAVPLQAQGVQGIPLSVLGLQQPEVGLPLVPDDFAAREATHRNDHGAAGQQHCPWEFRNCSTRRAPKTT